MKGTKAGVNTLYAQQMLLMEMEALKQKKAPSPTKCPRKEAILALSTVIGQLQEQNHSIILNIDANQTPLECHNEKGVKPCTI
jgi:hypothetical protein